MQSVMFRKQGTLQEKPPGLFDNEILRERERLLYFASDLNEL